MIKAVRPEKRSGQRRWRRMVPRSWGSLLEPVGGSSFSVSGGGGGEEEEEEEER